MDADVLAVPGTDSVIFGNTGGNNGPYLTIPEYKGGSTGSFQAALGPPVITGQPKGLTTDERGQVYATNTGGTSVSIYNSSLSAVVATLTGTTDPAGVAAQKIGSTYYAFVARGLAGTVERWNVTNILAPILDTSWGVNGVVNLKSVSGWINASINGIEVDRTGTIFLAGKLSTSSAVKGDTIFKVPADGNLSNAISTSVSGAMDVALFGDKAYATKYTGDTSAVAVLFKSDLTSAGADLLTGISRNNPDTDNGYSGIDVSFDGRLYVADQIYKVVQATEAYTPPATTFNPTPATINPTPTSPNRTQILFDRILVSSPVETATTVYVDDDWISLPNGTEVDSDPNTAGVQPAVIGFDAFPKIQSGVNAVADAGTVRVLAGRYAENVTVPKSVTLLGSNAGIDPNTGTRVAETIVVPAVTETSNQGSTSGTIFRLGTAAHTDVTIDGFTIDGHNGDLTGGRMLNGVEVNTGAGIINSIGSFDSNPAARDVTMTVLNNTLKNFERYGVLIDNTNDRTARAGNDVSFNKIDNIPSGNNFGGGRGRAAAFEENVYGTFSHNVVTRVNVGWQDDNYDRASPGAGTLIDGNEIHAYHRGIFHNLQYGNATNATISNNDIFAETVGDFPASANNFGIELSSIQGGVGASAINNDVTGTVYGVLLWNLPTTGSVSVSGGTLTDNQFGVLSTSVDPQFGPVGSSSKSSISGVSILNPTVAGISVDNTTGAGNLELGIGAGVSITGGPVGLTVNGPGTSITGDSLSNIAFTGQTEYVKLTGNTLAGIELNAEGATFDGVNGMTATPAQDFAIEDKITHAADNGTSGFVSIKAGNVFVTTGSATGGGGIQRGIAVAVPGDTVNVSPGIFDEDVNIASSGKANLTLLGSGAAITTLRGVLGGANETVLIGQDQTLDGFTITRSAGLLENDIGISVGAGSSGSVIRNNLISGNLTGINLNGGNSQSTITQNVIDDNRTGLLIPDVTGYGAYQISQNAITNNRTFGVLLANPTVLDAGFAIRGNNITGNYASQLENNSGSNLNASANWWGSPLPVVTPAKLDGTLPPEFDYPGPVTRPMTPFPYAISGDSASLVDHSPTLNSGTDTNLVAPGFQGDFGALNVFTAGAQSGPASRIQEGIDLSASGGTVKILAGSYGGFDGTGKNVVLSPEGIIEVNGTAKLAAGNTLKIDLAGTTPGSGYDQLAVTGSVDVTGATLNVVVAPGFAPNFGTPFQIIDNDLADPVVGEFAGLANNDTFSSGTRLLRVNYFGSPGNDVRLTVAGVSAAPSPDTIPGPQTVLEDHTLTLSTINGNPIAIGGIPGVLTDLKVSLSADNGAIITLSRLNGLSFTIGDGIADSAMTFTGSLTAINDALEGLSLTPVGDSNDTVTLTLNWDDQGASGPTPVPATDETVVVTITPVNDEPSFVKGSNQSVIEDAGSQSVPGWATLISSGPFNEGMQTVTFEATVIDNPSLFSVAPAIAADGTLTYTPADNANGTATINVLIKDNGGTSDGGDDTSAIQSFTIDVTPDNDAPSDIALGGNSVLENSPVGTVVGNFSTTDIDGDTAFTYSLVPGAGGDDNASFAIFGNTLKTNAVFDFEVKSSYSILVKSEDAGLLSTTKIFVITVNGINEQPTIDTTPTIMLPDVAKNATNPSGVQVGSLVLNATDAETPSTVGAAITGIHGTGGKWQTSINGSANSWVNLPVIPSGSVLLLNRNVFVRFVPNHNFIGFGGISYRAWDGQVGLSGNVVDPALNPIAFSTATDTAWVQVGPTTPNVDDAGRAILKKTTEDIATPPSQVSKTIVGFLGTDYPAKTVLGLAVTATTGDGKWQVKVGSGWQDITGVSPSSAYLLKATDSLRFLPSPDWHGNATITYRAWDFVQGSNLPLPRGNVSDLTRFSAESETAVALVTPVNDKPTLDLSVPRIFTDSNVARTVADLNALGANDVDKVLAPTPVNPAVVDNTNLGIAITKVTQKGGFWEYNLTPANASSWVKVPANVSTGSALLLNGVAGLRFNAGSSAVASGQLQYKAWDGTTVAVSGTRKSTTSGTSFSAGVETATFSLGNTPPTFLAGTAKDFPSTKENEFPKDVFTQKVVAAGGRRFLPPQLKQNTKLSGQPVSYLLGLFSDTGVPLKKGIAIYGSAQTLTTDLGGSADGHWEYMNDNKTWKPLGSVSPSSKLLLSSTDRLRFIPAEDAYGTATLSYNAWDQTTGVSGDRLTLPSDSVSNPEFLTSNWVVTQVL